MSSYSLVLNLGSWPRFGIDLLVASPLPKSCPLRLKQMVLSLKAITPQLLSIGILIVIVCSRGVAGTREAKASSNGIVHHENGFGVPGGIRTHGPLLRRQPLCPLSYWDALCRIPLDPANPILRMAILGVKRTVWVTTPVARLQRPRGPSRSFASTTA